jgi:protoheme IX farnesyltransferase
MLFGMIPYFAGWRGEGYFLSYLMVSFILFSLSLFGMRVKTQQNMDQWARNYFWGTLFYLPLALGVLLILR